MQKLLTMMLWSALALTQACDQPDPNRFETHIERIQQPDSRSEGFRGLEKLTKTVLDAPDNQDRLDEFATKVIPVFEELYPRAAEQREAMLTLLRDVGRPEASAVWNMALVLDGSSEVRKRTMVALDGIKKAKATDSVETLVKLFDKVVRKPALDDSKTDAGRLRVMMATTLGVLGDAQAVPVLKKALRQTRDVQPVAVHRAAAEALGRIGDPAAVDALLTVTFRVPDAPTTTNIGERSKLALAAIGEPAVPKILEMLRGEHKGVQDLAAENGVPQPVIQQTAAAILGAMGAKSAVEDLIGFMPTQDCEPPPPPTKRRKGKKGKKQEATEPPEGAQQQAAIGLRAMIANALGFIGDEKAVEPMCACVLATDHPDDMFPTMEALGRIGGPKAVACLSEVIKQGSYSSDVVRKGFELEPRWNAARFAILAATPEELPGVKAAMATNNDPTVKAELRKWEEAVTMAEGCQADAACYMKTLSNINADWFAREKAAFEVARIRSNEIDAAVAISKAFKVRNPDARISMAWLPTHMLKPGTKCGGCVDAMQAVLDAEKSSMDAKFQASVLRARATMAALRPSEAS